MQLDCQLLGQDAGPGARAAARSAAFGCVPQAGRQVAAGHASCVLLQPGHHEWHPLPRMMIWHDVDDDAGGVLGISSFRCSSPCAQHCGRREDGRPSAASGGGWLVGRGCGRLTSGVSSEGPQR